MAINRTRKFFSRWQSGATVIEFAFVFPVLFVIIYGTIVYGYVYFLQQRINFAAEEAIRAALAVDPKGPPGASASNSPLVNYTNAVTAAANNAVTQNFTPFTGSVASAFPGLLTPLVSFNSSDNSLTVTVTYSLVSPALFPVVNFGNGSIPPLPASLVAKAVGHLS